MDPLDEQGSEVTSLEKEVAEATEPTDRRIELRCLRLALFHPGGVGWRSHEFTPVNPGLTVARAVITVRTRDAPEPCQRRFAGWRGGPDGRRRRRVLVRLTGTRTLTHGWRRSWVFCCPGSVGGLFSRERRADEH
jgi:hypothetical protein